MELTPQNNYVLCSIEPVKFNSGLVIPGTDPKKKPSRLRVLAVGPGKLIDNGTRVPIPYQKGDYLVVHQIAVNAGRVQFLVPAFYGGRELALLDAGDIIATETGEIEPYLGKVDIVTSPGAVH